MRAQRGDREVSSNGAEVSSIKGRCFKTQRVHYHLSASHQHPFSSSLSIKGCKQYPHSPSILPAVHLIDSLVSTPNEDDDSERIAGRHDAHPFPACTAPDQSAFRCAVDNLVTDPTQPVQ